MARMKWEQQKRRDAVREATKADRAARDEVRRQESAQRMAHHPCIWTKLGGAWVVKGPANLVKLGETVQVWSQKASRNQNVRIAKVIGFEGNVIGFPERHLAKLGVESNATGSATGLGTHSSEES